MQKLESITHDIEKNNILEITMIVLIQLLLAFSFSLCGAISEYTNAL